jgi:hypothetical protein
MNGSFGWGPALPQAAGSTAGRQGSPGARRPVWVWCAMLLLAARGLFGAGAEVAFDGANKLYEEGKFAEAARSYESLLAQGVRSFSVYYNLGTACFRAGQLGRAVAAFRQAETLSPRDANLRADLQFVRKKVNGEDKSPVPLWQSWFTWLTLDEGAMLAAVALWVWFALLAAREAKPSLRKRLSGFTLAAGVFTVVLGACLAISVYVREGGVSAVVVVREAVVRFGPLEEAQTAFHLGDGSEVSVRDAKDNWLQVRDSSKRIGWVKRDQVVLLGDPKRLRTLR